MEAYMFSEVFLFFPWIKYKEYEVSEGNVIGLYSKKQRKVKGIFQIFSSQQGLFQALED